MKLKKIIEIEVDKIKEEPKDGVFIWGLHLEGAKWDQQHETLADQMLNILTYPLPMIYLQP